MRIGELAKRRGTSLRTLRGDPDGKDALRLAAAFVRGRHWTGQE